jgi:hypothetical protein
MVIKKIDTIKKEITIDETTNIGDLVYELKNLFKNDWREWSINVETVVNYYPTCYPNPPYDPFLDNQPYYHGDFFYTTSNNMGDYDFVKKKGKD